MSLAKSYEPQSFEKKIYEFWESESCFDAADVSASGQKSFCIPIPPPNVTGVLHMGHALTNTIQDILTRWRRMSGDNTLWIPGTDHAGIATQAVVEKAIAKEGKNAQGRPLSRHDLGREKFLERVWKWKEENGSQITYQLRRMGSSLDWKRERFTMDEGCSRAVREVFARLYHENLIYRGERIINWCPRCQTALSDLEVVPTERNGFLWHIQYSIVDDSEKNQNKEIDKVTIATTRPETLLGDTAIAIHPEDDRFKHLHGKQARLPLLGRLIPVICDEYVDREFGSGALKVTPAHDFNDYELGKKHELPSITVMGKDGKITAAGGPYAGLKFKEARERVIQDLKESGALIKTEDHKLKVGLCQRCDTVAEPIISKQWFVKIEPLAKPAIEAVETGKIEFVPKTWEKTYFEWMRNIRDWCISRQLWWGHQIPAWYCGRCQEITVSAEDPEKCAHCGAAATELRQDEDVLDTWFSSGLWPFATLGWPEKTPALKTFYPNSILETGFDIIFFWVARMIMMGLHFMKDVPFHKVYLHAMVRDEKGEKMSKSKGNVIDPLVLIDQHGADSLRFTLAIMSGQGRDVKLSLDRVAGYRAFCNKLWNVTKFFLMNLETAPLSEPKGGLETWVKKEFKNLPPQDRWILSRLQTRIVEIEKGLENFELNVSSQALYDFIWHELCDWYVEFSKLALKGEERASKLYVLHYVLDQVLRLLHPFAPFVTEELWQQLPWKGAATTTAREKAGLKPLVTLMLQSFPHASDGLIDRQAEGEVERVKSVIEAIRNFRGENGISPKQDFPARYKALSPEAREFIARSESEIKLLGKISELVESDKTDSWDSVIPLPGSGIELWISLKGLVNVEEESKRLRKESEKLESDLAHIRGKLSKESFVAKAPPELVAKERAKEQEIVLKLGEITANLKRLEGLAQ